MDEYLPACSACLLFCVAKRLFNSEYAGVTWNMTYCFLSVFFSRTSVSHSNRIVSKILFVLKKKIHIYSLSGLDTLDKIATSFLTRETTM